MSISRPPAKLKWADTPQGYECFCGSVNKFPVYVFAHWKERIASSCQRCGRAVNIKQGSAYPAQRRVRDPERKSFKQKFNL